MRFRDSILALALCLFLAGPATLFVFERVFHVDILDQLSSKSSEWLAGGTEASHLTDCLSVAGFESGELQTAIEVGVGNYIPMKADALLANACLQRGAIALSSSLFGWECYPTFFDSDILYSVRHEALFRRASVLNNDQKQGFLVFARQIAKEASANPEVRFVVFMAEMSQYSSANPELKYTSIERSSAAELKDMLASLEFPDNLSFIFEPFDDEVSFFEHNMKTDHHWNAQGIERGLTLISGELDSKVMKDMDCSVEVDGPPCNGSLARNGLMLLNEAPIGFNCVNGDITLLADGSAQSAGEHKGYFSSSEDAEVFNFYENYYENFSEVRGIGEGVPFLFLILTGTL